MDASASSERVGFWKRITGLFKGMLRLAAALTLAGVALGGFILGWQFIDASIKKAEAAPFEKAKEWPEANGPEGLRMKARSKLIDGQMYVLAEFTGNPAYLDLPANEDGSFTIQFRDADDFTVYSKQLPLNERSTFQDASGKPLGFVYEFDEYVGLESYARFNNAQLAWTLYTSMPEPPKPPDPPARPRAPNPAPRDPAPVSSDAAPAAKLDHCAPGLSRRQRLERLAAYGPVRETGSDTFETGGRMVIFYDDGSVMICR